MLAFQEATRLSTEVRSRLIKAATAQPNTDMQSLLARLGVGLTSPKYLYNCSLGLQEQLWSSYVLQRREGLAPTYSRRTKSHTVRIFHFQCYVVKEYTGDISKLASELSVLQQLHHDGLVSYLFIVNEGVRLSVFMDWAGQNLKDLAGMQQQPLGEDVARHVAYQLTDSLLYLHSKGIIHRDIKPDNIGVQPDFTVKLFDWGEALMLGKLQHLTDKQLIKVAAVAGTPLYMAPELLLYLTKKGTSSGSSADVTSSSDCSSASSAPGACAQSGCSCWGAASQPHQQQKSALRQLATPKLDIWGLGTVVYLLLAGKDILCDSYDLEDMADVVSASSGIRLPSSVRASAAARDFLARVLERDPAKRACAKELLGHPWLAGVSAAHAKRLDATNVKPRHGLSLPMSRSSEQTAAYVIAAHRGLRLARDSSSAPDTPSSEGAEMLTDTTEFE